jgi:hypothetical protein
MNYLFKNPESSNGIQKFSRGFEDTLQDPLQVDICVKGFAMS